MTGLDIWRLYRDERPSNNRYSSVLSDASQPHSLIGAFSDVVYFFLIWRLYSKAAKSKKKEEKKVFQRQRRLGLPHSCEHLRIMRNLSTVIRRFRNFCDGLESKLNLCC